MMRKFLFSAVSGSSIWRPLPDARRLSVARLSAFLLVCLILGACGGSDSALAPPIEDPNKLFYGLEFNHRAVYLGLTVPNNTLQLQVTPMNALGDSLKLDSLGTFAVQPPVWVSRDSSLVRVSSSGKIVALREAANRVFIVVSQRIGNITRKDSVGVLVRDFPSPPILKTFSIRMRDSVKRAVGWTGSVKALALDETGDTIQNLLFYALSDDRAIVNVVPWSLTSGSTYRIMNIQKALEQVTIRASVWWYGHEVRDSFTLETGGAIRLLEIARILQEFNVRNGQIEFVCFGCVKFEAGPGVQVVVDNQSGRGPTNVPGVPAGEGKSIDVIFDDPTAALEVSSPASRNSGSGNIADIPFDTTQWGGTQRYRRFTKPGEYHYTIQPFGFQGVLVILPR